MRTLLWLTIANIKSLARDKAAVFWSFAFPIMFVLLFGAIFGGGGGSSKITVGFVDEDGTPVSAGIQSAFAGVELLNLKTGTLEAEKAAMQRGDVSAVIVIPKGTAAAVGAGTPIALEIYIDPTNTQTTQVVQNVATQIANGFNLQLAHGTVILTVEQRTLQQSEGLTAVGYLVPSILAMALMQLGVFAAIPLVQQREKGILKRLGATPLARWQLVGSNVLERLVVAIVDAVLIIGIGLLVFDVKILGSLLMVTFLVLLGAAAFLALGYALASFLKTTEQAEGVVQVVQIPMMFLSGIFFSFEFLPGVLQTIARLLPLTYLGDALRQVMVNGPQIVPLGVDIAILAGWLIVSLAVSARFFRWE
jgi:ABC-2 type transport system permease protein